MERRENLPTSAKSDVRLDRPVTARDCLANQWGFSIACPGCRTLRSMGALYASRIVAKGWADVDLGRVFAAGKLKCSQHGLPASFLSVSAWEVGAHREIARWQKEDPAGEGGAR